ncbi:MAG: sulfatase [Candidatus Eisenbacteria bacterium]
MSRRLFVLPLLLLSLAGCGGGPPPAARNAVVILIDTCRYDDVGRTTPAGAVTPHLDRFAASAASLTEATAPAPWTLPSAASLLTAVYPTEHGALGHYPGFSRLRPEVPTAPEILRENGFRTGALINVAFLHPTLGLDRGFETYDHAPGPNRKVRRAAETFEAAIRWVDAHRGERFFLLIHLFDPHMDFDPPEPHLSRFLDGYSGPLRPPFGDVKRWREEKGVPPEVRDFARALYRAEIAAVDEACGRFLAHLDSTGLAGETVVVVTADHGEEFWDHGAFEHGHTLFEELIHIPLLIRQPGRDWPRRVAGRVGLVDVMPTLFDILGLPAHPGWRGESLLPLLEGEGALSPRYRFSEALLYGYERKVVVGDRYKFTWDEARGRMALFDLAADPRETRNIAEERPETAREMARVLHDWYRGILDRTGGSVRGEEVNMEEDVVAELRALGYVE